MGKTLVNTINFPTSFGRNHSQVLRCLYDSIIHATLFDIDVIYLIRMQREETAVNGRSTACRGFNLVLDLK